MRAIGTVGVLLAAGMFFAPAGMAQPVDPAEADEALVEGEPVAEAVPEPADTADLELRLTKQILLLQRQINQLTRRINDLESGTEP
jgi:hypothetical protein